LIHNHKVDERSKGYYYSIWVATLLILIIPFSILTSFLVLLSNSFLDPIWEPILLIYLVLGHLSYLFAFWLNRNGYYKLATSIIITIMLIFIFLNAIFGYNGQYASFVHILIIVPILISYILLSTVFTFVLFVLCIVFILILPLIQSHYTYSFIISGPFLFILFVFLMLTLATISRHQMGEFRRKTVEISEEKYRMFMEQAADGIFIHDVKGKFLEVNDQACTLTGYEQSELMTMEVKDLLLGDQLQKQPMHLEERPLGYSFTRERIFTSKGGKEIPIETNSKRLSDGKFLVIVRDISERKKVEDAIKSSEERYRSLFEAVPVSLWEEDFSKVKEYLDNLKISDFNQLDEYLEENIDVIKELRRLVEVIGVNQTTFELFKAKDVESIISSLWLSYTEVSHLRFKDMLIHMLKKDLPFEWQTSYLALDGKVLESIVRVVVPPGYEDTLSRVLISLVDISELKRAEEALQQSEEKLRQAQKMESIGRLAGGIAHDFNNLLTGVLGYAELLLQDMDDNHQYYSDINQIISNAERAASLTRQLLAFSRKQVLHPVVISLNTILNNMEDMIKRLVGEKIVVKLSLNNQLSSIKADPNQIEQIVMNLVVNSRDAMPDGGYIEIVTDDITKEQIHEMITDEIDQSQSNFVLLSVIDSGHGIDDETKENLFEPFFTTKSVGKGTGLGLATVYGIVKQSNGYISFESEIGEGTQFDIFFPTVDQDIEEREILSFTPSSALASETVLLVEDEASVREISRKILVEQGYDVLEATNGEEALQIWRENQSKINLILTDVVMPGINGYELASIINKEKKNVKILYMSGYTEEAISPKEDYSSNVALLEKPFTPTELLTAVRKSLDT
jgi:PAS domain S-box-containing protein